MALNFQVQTARIFGISAKVVERWVRRFRTEGRAGMADRPSRSKGMPGATAPVVVERIAALRRRRWTGWHIALKVRVSTATVRRVLKRAALSRFSDLEFVEQARRNECEIPGEMIHIDIKKLGRFDCIGHRINDCHTDQSNSHCVGWEFVHVSFDDHSRLTFSQILAR